MDKQSNSSSGEKSTAYLSLHNLRIHDHQLKPSRYKKTLNFVRSATSDNQDKFDNPLEDQDLSGPESLQDDSP